MGATSLPFVYSHMKNLTPRRVFAATALMLTIISVTAAAQRVIADLSGTWLMSISMQGNTSQSTVNLKQTGDSLSGTISMEQIGTRNLVGSVKSDTVRFTFSIDMQGQVMELYGAGLLKDKDNIDGQLDLPQGMGSIPFAAKRQP